MFIYTAMNPNGTGLMMLLGLPFVGAALLAGLAFQDVFSGAYLVAVVLAPLIWSVAYTKTLRWFNNLKPTKPASQFLAGVLAVDLLLVAGVVYAAA